MSADTQEAPATPATTAPAVEFKLSPPRAAKKTGMPTDGLWLFAGLPKAGKTTLASTIPGGIILELERGGADRVSGWVQDVPNLPTFRKALVAAIKAPEVKVIVIDTLDVLLDWVEDDVAAQFGLENMSERKEGVNGFAVWGELRKRTNSMVEVLKTCGKLVILLAHYKDPKLDADGKVVISQAINAPGKTGSYICGQADAIGNCFKRPMGQATQYVVSFQGGHGLGTFGSRIAELEDRVIVLPKTNQWAAIEAAFKPAEGSVSTPAEAAAPQGGKTDRPAKGKGGK